MLKFAFDYQTAYELGPFKSIVPFVNLRKFFLYSSPLCLSRLRPFNSFTKNEKIFYSVFCKNLWNFPYVSNIIVPKWRLTDARKLILFSTYAFAYAESTKNLIQSGTVPFSHQAIITTVLNFHYIPPSPFYTCSQNFRHQNKFELMRIS